MIIVFDVIAVELGGLGGSLHGPPFILAYSDTEARKEGAGVRSLWRYVRISFFFAINKRINITNT